MNIKITLDKLGFMFDKKIITVQILIRDNESRREVQEYNLMEPLLITVL